MSTSYQDLSHEILLLPNYIIFLENEYYYYLFIGDRGTSQLYLDLTVCPKADVQTLDYEHKNIP